MLVFLIRVNFSCLRHPQKNELVQNRKHYSYKNFAWIYEQHTYLTNISSVLQYIDGKVYRHFPLYLPRLIIIIWFGNAFINRTIYVDVAQHAGLQIQVRQSCWRGQHDAWTSLRTEVTWQCLLYSVPMCSGPLIILLLVRCPSNFSRPK